MSARKILIVEDEAIAAINIRMMLTDRGYDVIGIVFTGEKAIKTTLQEKPDLVLMDIALVGEMDGIEAAERIRKQSAVPIVFITAHADRETKERAMTIEPAGFLEKPVDDYQLIEVLESIF